MHFMPLRARARAAGGRAPTRLLVAALLIGLALPFARPAAAARPASLGSPSLVFSEVYAPLGSSAQAQWFEIHNLQTTISYPLDGLVIATGERQVTLHSPAAILPNGYVLFVLTADAVSRGGVVPLPRATVIPVPDLQSLNPEADALIMKTPDGSLVIDALNWGTPDPNWLNYDKTLLWNPGLPPLDGTTCGGCTWGRTPADRDSNLARPPDGDWTLHATPSPGGAVAPPVQPAFLGRWTDVAGALGSLLLWLAFVIIAIIAYRFERLRDTRTYWQLLLLAPSGLLFYTVVVILGFSQAGGLSDFQKWLSFPVLAISALFCLLAVGVFRNVARTLLEGE